MDVSRIYRHCQIIRNEVKINEIYCENLDALHYFNKRCIHNTPNQKSIKCFNTWQIDPRVLYYEPFIPELPGDTLPKTNPMSLKDMDIQLKCYWDNIPTNNVPFKQITTCTQTIMSINSTDYNEVFERDYSFNKPLDGRYDLREDRPHM